MHGRSDAWERVSHGAIVAAPDRVRNFSAEERE
jgi:hypothetical protein